MELHVLARYPFLPQAGAYIDEHGPGLGELLSDPVYADARRSGRARVLAALEGADLPTPPLAGASPPRELLEELLSYAYARILVSAAADAYVVRRHALAEAVRVRAYLAADEPERVAEAAASVALDFRPQSEGLQAHFGEYLKQAVHLKDLEWKLVRQPLARGVVAMDARAASRLVQEALRRRIESELPKQLPPEVVKALAADLAPIREIAQAMKERYSVEGTFGKVDLSLMPPCMQHILGQLQRGENAAHNARFAIVTFLHKIGMSSEQIMGLFAQAPDFKEEMTRYQVEHITGVSSGTTYNVPGCDNLQTFNLCHADDLCRTTFRDGRARVRYPGDYYRFMQEAKPHVDAIALRVPIANPARLVWHAARQYSLLKRLEALAQRPWLEQLDGARLLRLAMERKAPVRVEEDRLVVDDADPWSVVLLLESEWAREALAQAPTTGPKPP